MWCRTEKPSAPPPPPPKPRANSFSLPVTCHALLLFKQQLQPPSFRQASQPAVLGAKPPIPRLLLFAAGQRGVFRMSVENTPASLLSPHTVGPRRHSCGSAHSLPLPEGLVPLSLTRLFFKAAAQELFLGLATPTLSCCRSRTGTSNAVKAELRRDADTLLCSSFSQGTGCSQQGSALPPEAQILPGVGQTSGSSSSASVLLNSPCSRLPAFPGCLRPLLG